MNILILRVSSIGDIIHTLPTIFFLKKVSPNIKISWVVQEKAGNLLKNQPYLENVWTIKNGFLKPKNWSHTYNVIKEIKKTKWDAILDFQGILKTSILSFFIKGEKYGFDINNSRLWITSFFTNKHTKPLYKNIIQKNLALASSLFEYKQKESFKHCPAIHSFKKDFSLNIPSNEQSIVINWLKKNNIQKFIALSPNTTWPSKHWPLENWEHLIKLLSSNNEFLKKHSIVLIGEKFGAHAMQLGKIINQKKYPVYIAPNLNLLATSFLISKSELLVAPDTGLLHIADFLDKKTIGIFGPTKAKIHGPFLNDKNIENAIQVKCKHHYLKNHGKKPKNINITSKQYDCMYKLSPEKLIEKILKILNG